MINRPYKLNHLTLFGPYDDEWSSTTRSIRIDGTVTSVRLENVYWRVIDDIARQNNLRVPQLMTELQIAAKSGNIIHTNFTSFIRVCCCRYLSTLSKTTSHRKGSQDVIRPDETISDVD